MPYLSKGTSSHLFKSLKLTRRTMPSRFGAGKLMHNTHAFDAWIIV